MNIPRGTLFPIMIEPLLSVDMKNNKVYIGATTKSVGAHKADHIQKTNKGDGGYFREAIATYGHKAFFWEQLDTANDVNKPLS